MTEAFNKLHTLGLLWVRGQGAVGGAGWWRERPREMRSQRQRGSSRDRSSRGGGAETGASLDSGRLRLFRRRAGSSAPQSCLML